MLELLAAKKGYYTPQHLAKSAGVDCRTIKRLWNAPRGTTTQSKIIVALATVFNLSNYEVMLRAGLDFRPTFTPHNGEKAPTRYGFRQLRLAHGWSLQRLAMAVGCHYSTLEMFEQGRRKISKLLLARIWATLNLAHYEITRCFKNINTFFKHWDTYVVPFRNKITIPSYINYHELYDRLNS